MATMKVNDSIGQTRLLTGVKSTELWRYPNEEQLSSKVYHDTFYRRLDRLKLHQLRLIAGKFDTELPGVLTEQAQCKDAEVRKILWTFLAALFAVASIVLVYRREKSPA